MSKTGALSEPTLFDLLPEQVINDYFVKPFLLSPVLGEKSGESTKPYHWLNETIETQDLYETLAALTPPTSIKIRKMIKLVCKHKPLADKIVQSLFDKSIADNPSKKRIALSFGEHYLPIAEKIMADNDLRNELNQNDLSQLGEEHLSIALQIVNDESLVSKLGPTNLAALGRSHLPVAKLILKNNNLLNKLQGFHLAMLGTDHESIAQIILNDESLRLRLSNSDIVSLGCSHLSIAHQLFNDDKFLNSLDHLDLFRLGKAHLFAAQKIFHNQTLRQRISLVSLTDLAAIHFSIAQKIIDDKALRTQFKSTLPYIGSMHPIIRDQIMSNPELRSELTQEGYVLLNADNLEVAQEVMDNKSLRSSLSKHTLCMLACKHLSIAQQIISDEQMWNYLGGYYLRDIAKKHRSIAEIIMRNKTMILKLHSEHSLIQLIDKYPDLALQNKEIIMRLPLSQPDREFIDHTLNCATTIFNAVSQTKDEIAQHQAFERKRI